MRHSFHTNVAALDIQTAITCNTAICTSSPRKHSHSELFRSAYASELSAQLLRGCIKAYCTQQAAVSTYQNHPILNSMRQHQLCNANPPPATSCKCWPHSCRSQPLQKADPKLKATVQKANAVAFRACRSIRHPHQSCRRQLKG